MKVVILAGGFGTRLGTETGVIPKPMVSIGNKPILWHIMRYYAHFGFNKFVVALGYKSECIKQYFYEYMNLDGDMSVNLASRKVERLGNHTVDWKVDLIETGLDTMTGGRVKRLENIVGNERFMLTYGDGVANVDLMELIATHERQGVDATVTAVRPPSRFGGVSIEDQKVTFFVEKPQVDVGWINGGFMVLEPSIFDLLKSDDDLLEVTVLEQLAQKGQLAAFQHERFWQCMDTPREMNYLNKVWDDGSAPWKVWK